MGRDMDYFKERILDKTNIKDFYNQLPGHLQSKFKASLRVVIEWGNVLQGYRGPSDFCNNGSGDSATLPASNGVQEIRYWWGVRKDLNAQIPVLGTLAFAVGRTVQAVSNQLEWSSLYFDSKTGECLSHDKNEAAEKLNTTGCRLFDEGRYSEAAEYHDNAYRSCSSGYCHEREFKDNEKKAKSEVQARSLNAQGDVYFEQGKYTKARDKYKEAYDKSVVSKEYEIYDDSREKAQCEIDAEDLNSKGDCLFEEGKYNKAYDTYRKAYNTSQVRTEYRRYKTNREKAQCEIDAKDLNSRADNLLERGKYGKAEIKYQKAYDTSQVRKEKNLYSSNKDKVKNIVNKLSILDHLWAEAWDAENDVENDRSEKAKETFQKVLKKSEKFFRIFPDNRRFKQYKNLVSLKVEGNEVFNEGLTLQQNGVSLFQAAEKLKRQKKYKLANEKFKKAKKYFQKAIAKFEAGSKVDQRFVPCVEFVQEHIDEIKKSIDMSEQRMLNEGLNKLDIDIDSDNRSDALSDAPDEIETRHNYFAHI